MLQIEDLNPKGYILTQFQKENLEILFEAVSELERQYDEDFIVTSGVRTPEEQERINPKVKHSAHIAGSAVDVLDLDHAIYQFCVDNIPLIKKLGLYIEDRSVTVRWIHLQTRRPPSGNIFFIP